MSIEVAEFRTNHAIAKVADYVDQTRISFTFDKDTVEKIEAERSQPFYDAYEGMHAIEKARIKAGVQTLTFKPGRTYGFTTTGYGR